MGQGQRFFRELTVINIPDSVPDMPVMTAEVPEPDDPLTGILTLEFRELNSHDRCDKRLCSAQAMMIAVKPKVGELLFCGHHGRKLFPALIGNGFLIDDQQPRLVPVGAPGASA
jgi:hypothetical protein